MSYTKNHPLRIVCLRKTAHLSVNIHGICHLENHVSLSSCIGAFVYEWESSIYECKLQLKTEYECICKEYNSEKRLTLSFGHEISILAHFYI